MAFVGEQVTNPMRRGQGVAFREWVDELELELGSPIRVLELQGESRSPGRLRDWRGISAEPTHYSVAADREALSENGITIYSYGWLEGTEATFDMGQLPTTWTVDPDQVNGPRWVDYQIGAPHLVEELGGAPLLYEGEIHGDRTAPFECTYGAIYNEGRDVFIGYSLSYLANQYARPLNWNTFLGDPIRERIDPERREAAATHRRTHEQRIFRALMQDQGDSVVRRLESEILEHATQAGRLEEELVNEKATNENLNRALAFQLETGEHIMTEERIEAEREAIERCAHVKSWQVRQSANGGSMILRSHLLWLTNPETNRTMPLGEYSITFDFENSKVRINNMTHSIDRWDHPHVAEAELCAGDYRGTVTAMLRDRRLAALTNMIFTILHTITLEDPWGRNGLARWEREDDLIRERNNWPEWEPAETQHPMLADNNETQEAA